MSRTHLRVPVSVFLVAMMLVVTLLPSAGLAALSAGTPVRLSPEAYARVGALPGALDYGTFVYVEADAAAMARIAASGVAYEVIQDGTKLALNGYRFDPLRDAQPSFPTELMAAPDASGGLYVVQFAGPMRDEWLSGLAALGARPVRYVAQNGYLVWMNPTQAATAAQAPYVRWSGYLEPGYRLHTNLFGRVGTIEKVVSFFYDDAAAPSFPADLAALGAVVRDQLALAGTDGLWYVEFSLPADRLVELGRLSRLVFANWATAPQNDDEISNQIQSGYLNAGATQPLGPGYQSFLTSWGVDGTGVVVSIVDSDVDQTHVDLAAGLLIEYGAGTGGHGTHVAGIAVGRAGNGAVDSMGYLYGQGVAPGAQYIDQYYDDTHENFTLHCIQNNCILTQNSWNTGSPAGYTAEAALYDQLVRDGDQGTAGAQPVTVDFSAGNSGTAGLTQPHEAKNIMSVASSNNWRSSAGAPGSGTITAISSFSSRGPCADGRICPYITGVGQNVVSAADSRGGSCSTPHPPGSAIHGVCSGTSMSTPQVSGATALVEQWYRAHYGNVSPSPAMRKAMLINGARDLGTADIPNSNEGWGIINLDTTFTTTVPIVRYDQTVTFGATGEAVAYNLVAGDGTKPMKVSLVWSDAPGTPGGNAWVNDLNLRVQNQTATYYGNVFSAGWSTTGGAADTRNNIEGVYLQTPGTTEYRLIVEAANIAGDGVPYNADPTDQDFALVCWNCVITAVPTDVAMTSVTSAAVPAAFPVAGLALAGVVLLAGLVIVRKARS